MSLAQLLSQLGSAPGFGGGFIQGRKDRSDEETQALKRRALEFNMEQAEALAPYELLKAQREAIHGPQTTPTAMQKNFEFLKQQGMDPTAALGLVTDDYTIVQTDQGPRLFSKSRNAYVSPSEAAQVQQGANAIRTTIPTEAVGTEGATEGLGFEEPKTALQLKQEELQREAAKADADAITKGAASYGDDLLKTKGLLESERVIGSLNSRLHKFAGEGEDVPSRGYLERLTPGIIKDLADDAGFKNWFISDEGLTIRNEAAMAGKMFVSSISGADVTDEEQARYDQMLGQLNSSSKEEFLQGLRTLQELTKVRKRHIGAKYPKEVRDRYWEQFEGTEDEGLTEYGAIGGGTAEGQQGGSQTQPIARPQDPNAAWSAIRQAYPDAPESALLEAAKAAGDLPSDYSPPSPRGDRGQRGGAVARSEATQTPVRNNQPTPEQNLTATQQAIGILQDQMNKGASKKAVLNTLNEMKSEGIIDIKQYRQIVKELQLGTFDVQSQRRNRGSGQRGGGTR